MFSSLISTRLAPPLFSSSAANPSCFWHLGQLHTEVLNKHMAEQTSVPAPPKPVSSVEGSCGAMWGWAQGPEALEGKLRLRDLR